MGLLISVYRNPLGDCTANGISSNASSLCVVNVDGPFEPSEDSPAVKLVRADFSFGSMLRLIPVDTDGAPVGSPMFGGNLGATSDSRFGRACESLSGSSFSIDSVKIFDRYE